MSSNKECPICAAPATVAPSSNNTGYTLNITCPRCGDYLISEDATRDLKLVLGFDQPSLNTYSQEEDSCIHNPVHALGVEVARKAVVRGIGEPRSILSHALRKRMNKQPQITTDSLIKILKGVSLPSPAEQADNLILFLGGYLDSPGSFFKISPAEDTRETIENKYRQLGGTLGLKIGKEWDDLYFIVTSLEEQGTIRVNYQKDVTSGNRRIPVEISLTLAGWQRYEKLTQQQVESRTAFMAMQFDDEVFKVVDKHFKPAVSETGFELRTLIDGQAAGLIDDQLRVALRRAKFVIADLTHNNNGAYWEAGFAEGLGRPVIYTCRKKEWTERKTHFDTNHLVTIIWEPENFEDAARRLIDTIRATLPDAK